MLTSAFLLMVPMVLCAPIQQWTVNSKYDDSKISISTTNLMIHDDIQGYYENILDEVISTHNEDVLVQLAHSMNDQHSLERLLQPQAIALLHHPVQETCVSRMPGMIAQHLHHLHKKLLNKVEPTIDTLLKTHSLLVTEQQQPHNDDHSYHQHQGTNMMEKLTLLNKAVDQHVMQILKQARLEHKLALDLSTCEIQQNQLVSSSSSTSPSSLPQNHRSLWRLIKNLWNKAAEASSATRPGRMMAELDGHGCNEDIVLDNLVTVVLGEQQDENPLFIPGPSLLQTHLDAIANSLHLEFKSRLADLHTMLLSDVFDEEIV